MKCDNCSTNIDSGMNHSLKNNMCPYCGGSIWASTDGHSAAVNVLDIATQFREHILFLSTQDVSKVYDAFFNFFMNSGQDSKASPMDDDLVVESSAPISKKKDKEKRAKSNSRNEATKSITKSPPRAISRVDSSGEKTELMGPGSDLSRATSKDFLAAQQEILSEWESQQ